MATGAAEMMLRCVFNGSLSLCDMDIERRPYHKYCSCALHTSKNAYPSACLQHGCISFPKKELWPDCSLSSVASSNSFHSSFPGDSMLRTRYVKKESSSRR